MTLTKIKGNSAKKKSPKKSLKKKVTKKKAQKSPSIRVVKPKGLKFEAKTSRLMPVKQGATWGIKAYPSVTSLGVSQNKGVLQLPGRRGVTISTGLTLKEVPEGYKFCFTTHESLAQKGGIVVNTGHITDGDIFLTIYNIGAAIIPLREGDVVAKGWIEPVYEYLGEIE